MLDLYEYLEVAWWWRQNLSTTRMGVWVSGIEKYILATYKD